MIQFIKPFRDISRVFLHCSASDNESLVGRHLVDEIDGWHKIRGFYYGWNGQSGHIGYHFVIDKQGNVMAGRPLEVTPAAQEGNNRGTIAICVHGLALEKFTDTALSACLDLCDQINHAYEGHIEFWGHCEVSAKSCPVFSYRELLQLDETRHMPLEPRR